MATASSPLSQTDMLLMLPLGVFCAGFGIAIMRGVSFIEAVFRWTRLPHPLHPAVGGLIVGGLALLTHRSSHPATAPRSRFSAKGLRQSA